MYRKYGATEAYIHSLVTISFHAAALSLRAHIFRNAAFPWRSSTELRGHLHGLAAAWAAHRHGVVLPSGLLFLGGELEAELAADGGELRLRSGVHEAVVADGVEAAGQSVLEIAANELDWLDVRCFKASALAVLNRYADAGGIG